MKQAPFSVRRWTRAEYEALVERGVFDGEPLELLGGQLIVAEPQGPYHASSVGRITDALKAVLPPGWIVREEKPVALDDESEPEPDIAVVRGSHGDYEAAHPSRPALVIEVAHTSLGFDRAAKASFYARAGIDDYWIVNLLDGALEVYRAPAPDAGAPSGWRYMSVEVVRSPGVVAPLAIPSTRIAIADLVSSR